MSLTWEQALAEFEFLCSQKFPDANAETRVTKFEEEAQEFLDDPSSEEAMDCIQVLLHWFWVQGLDPLCHFMAGMEKLRGRSFELQPDGTYQRKKPGK